MKKFLSKIHEFRCAGKQLFGTKANIKYQPADKNKGTVIISCKRPELDHYSSMHYNNLDIVPLASKGWNHSKSKEDFFTIQPYLINKDPVMYSFRELDLDPRIIQTLSSDGILKATEFQLRTSQAVRTGSHLLLAAETGSGKTLSYVLPVIQKLLDNKVNSDVFNTPRAVVLLPNRELAYQIGEIAKLIGSSVGVNVKVVVGGRTKSAMMNPAFEELDILVATPGALWKLSSVGIYKLDQVKFLVLDEADTLLDNSFEEIVAKLVWKMSQSQIIFVSATVPKSFPTSLAPLQNNLKEILSPEIHKPLLNIKQKFMRLTRSRKPSHLLKIVKNCKDPMIVFTNKNETCNWLALFLRENGTKCSNINGDMNYALRIEQWNQFVRGETNILSATDVASRGLNTVQVGHLVNYDFPLYAADYLHRIGRIGRLGSPMTCKATNFITSEQEVKLVQQIELAIRTNQPLDNVDGNITRLIEKKKRRAGDQM